MNDAPGEVPKVGEERKKPAPTTRQSYRVKIVEIVQGEVERQTFREIVPAIVGRGRIGDQEAVPSIPAKMGFLTEVIPVQYESALFEGVFLKKPSLVALARLMEGGKAP
jgi:hypothetical protein